MNILKAFLWINDSLVQDLDIRGHQRLLTLNDDDSRHLSNLLVALKTKKVEKDALPLPPLLMWGGGGGVGAPAESSGS